ncbi:GNAT family N-acetyltransferase [Pseudotenacibaculum sp. MALMAid0570]|uniref:GNAT family N-acetyltransferase n=1 Tax=Pseudotenacibaculum sp. MALMAid0570 TaxID=3143938 RepID=UPI0032DF5424
MNIQFKQIEIKDKQTVLNLFKETAEKIHKMNVDHWQYWKNPPQEKIQWVEKGIQNNEFFFINLEGDENIGMVRIMNEDFLYWGEQNKKAKYIHSLVIKETYNGKGIGSLVIDAIGKRALKNDCKYLRLDAVSNNISLCKYYEKLGFKKVGEKEMPLSINNLYQKKL